MNNPGELERLRALVESLQAQLTGSGAIAQGDGAVAVGQGGQGAGRDFYNQTHIHHHPPAPRAGAGEAELREAYLCHVFGGAELLPLSGIDPAGAGVVS